MRFLTQFVACLILFAGCCLAPSSLSAQEEHASTAAEHQVEEHAGEEHGDEHAGEAHAEGEHHHKNEFGLVLGGTYEAEEEETLFTVGLEYARVINPTVHMAFIVEHLSTVDAWVFIAPVHLYPWKSSGFFFALGPGVEHKSRRLGGEHGGEHGGGHEEGPGELPAEMEQGENLFLWRTGIGYNFEIGKRLKLAPGLDWDMVRENGEWVDAFVFDVAIGFGF